MGIRNPYFPAIANTWQAGQVFNGAITMTAGLTLSNQAVLIRLTAIGNTAYINSTNSLPIGFQYGGAAGQVFNKNGTITNAVGGGVTTGTIPTAISPTVASGTVYQNTTNSYQTLTLPFYASTAGTAGSVTINMGTSSTPGTWTTVYVSGSTSSTACTNYTLRVPPQWYYEVVVSGATIGTVNGVQE